MVFPAHRLRHYATSEQPNFRTSSTTTTTTAATLPAARGAELCNPLADKARFGEIWGAEILLKPPLLLLGKFKGWKSHGIGLGWI